MDVYGIITGATIFVSGAFFGVGIFRYATGLTLKIAATAMYGGQLNDTPVDQEFTQFEEDE